MGLTRTVKTVGFCLVLLAVVLALPPVQVNAATGTIFSDAQDGYVASNGGGGSAAYYMYVGDDGSNNYVRAFVKFSLAGISGLLSSATLHLYLYASYHDDATDYASPLTNPGLGFCVVRHIGDYGTLDPTDFDAASIGNDPGPPLLTNTVTPDKGYVSIDVRTAMQDDIDNARSFSSFMIYLTNGVTSTDNDNRADGWEFFTSEQPETAADPYIEYGPAPVTVTSTVTTTETTTETSYVPTTTTETSTSISATTETETSTETSVSTEYVPTTVTSVSTSVRTIPTRTITIATQTRTQTVVTRTQTVVTRTTIRPTVTKTVTTTIRQNAVAQPAIFGIEVSPSISNLLGMLTALMVTMSIIVPSKAKRNRR